jgi:two-component system response regulator
MADEEILLVEDNPDDEELTLRALRKSGIRHSVAVARDGPQALDFLFGAAPLSPRGVLLDLKLPKLSGLEVLRKIRSEARTRLLPVVVLTSSVEERDLAESYGLGANSYVRKPVEFDAFVEVIRTLGNYWLKLNERPR